jgi:cytochrome c biogenesis protein CcmG/thiol:disulfide interchange protein DsbE
MVNKQAQKEGLGKYWSEKKIRSRIYTGIFIVAAVIFFIMNNSEELPEQGPYPPNYTPTNTSSLQQAALFSLQSTDGALINLSDYKGKIVILDFWATWCPPCRRGIPDLIELKNEYGDKIEIIGISVDTDSKSEVVPFMKEYGINYPVVYGNMSVYQQYGGIRSIPTQFILNKEGKIFKKYIGLVPKTTYQTDLTSLINES